MNSFLRWFMKQQPRRLASTFLRRPAGQRPFSFSGACASNAPSLQSTSPAVYSPHVNTALVSMLATISLGASFLRTNDDVNTTRCAMESGESDFAALGVNEQDVDDLVRELLADPNVNIPMVPDAIEKHLYKSTILLTLNAIYSTIFSMNGTKMLSHEIVLSVERRNNKSSGSEPSSLSKVLAKGAAAEVNDVVLHEVADRLLANPAVNSPWIPDKLEREVYFSCLQVIFRILQVAFSSIKIKMCGHELSLRLGSVSKHLEEAALNISGQEGKPGNSVLTPVDLELLREMAREAGVDDETNNDYWWNRLFTSSDFVEHLHVSLYGLILGVLDDFFGQLEIHVLSDTIQLDLVPSKSVAPESGDDKQAESSTDIPTSGGGVSVESYAAASFAAGVGIGVTLMAVLTSSHR